jgi:hypothetical protein
MKPLPATNLRSNVGTWVVPSATVPAVAAAMLDSLPRESYDLDFQGQELQTIYFDTSGLLLRKARHEGERYLTLRLRCYERDGQEDFYALSAKTEREKWRQEISAEDADAIRSYPDGIAGFLPANLLARLDEICQGARLLEAAVVCCRRYAVESDRDRLTLDANIRTSAGKRLRPAILEFKSLAAAADVPTALANLRLSPVKLSKFLWATEM